MSSNPPPPASAHFPPLELPAGLHTEYVNIARIVHSPSELVFDFAQLLPGTPTVEVKSRIVMSPLGAKLFLRALEENLAKFEAAYGEINIPRDSSLANQLFRQAPHASDPT